MIQKAVFSLFGLLLLGLGSCAQKVTGELMQWHRVTLTFNGPELSESGTPNPFTDYRLWVTFTQGDRELVVPGFFAADGQAGESGATSGNQWRVHFAPPTTGDWKWRASFRTG